MLYVPQAAPTASDELRQWFLDAQARPSDIHQLLDVMRDVAQGCRHITELGVGQGQSTLAWLLVQPDELLLVDMDQRPELAGIFRLAGQTKVTFWRADSLVVELPQTDLLFIDTTHTYSQLKKELRLHGNKANRYIIMHDTTIYGDVGADGRAPGLWHAVEEFLKDNPHWTLLLRYCHCNGLTILERKA